MSFVSFDYSLIFGLYQNVFLSTILVFKIILNFLCLTHQEVLRVNTMVTRYFTYIVDKANRDVYMLYWKAYRLAL